MLIQIMILINPSEKLHVDGLILQGIHEFIRIINLTAQSRHFFCCLFFFVLIPVLEGFARLTLNGNIFRCCNYFVFHSRVIADFIQLFNNVFPHRLKVWVYAVSVIIKNLRDSFTSNVGNIFNILILFEETTFADDHFS